MARHCLLARIATSVICATVEQFQLQKKHLSPSPEVTKIHREGTSAVAWRYFVLLQSMPNLH